MNSNASLGREPVTGLVLSGGGARGAYEVGVLAYLFQELPERAAREVRFRVLSGTSVGAVHACFLAGSAHRPQYDISKLMSIWRSLRLERMLRLKFSDLTRDFSQLLRAATQPATGVLLSSDVLQNVVERDLPWRQIRHNLHAGELDAVAVSTTHIATGRTVTFVDRRGGGTPPWTRDVRREARPAHLRPIHALASAAIPFLFPAIPIDGSHYCDGGLRMNTPLSPALRLGADRVLVIGLRTQHPSEHAPRSSAVEEDYPGPAFLIGKLLDALMLDRLDYDMARLEGINRLLRDGRETFGADFAERLNVTMLDVRGSGYREVETLVIRPSRDIGDMATAFARAVQPKLGGVPGWMLSKIIGSDPLATTDLTSFLMFDGRFAEELIQLGMADADAQRDRLVDFFGG